jgi:hypothetical protein
LHDQSPRHATEVKLREIRSLGGFGLKFRGLIEPPVLPDGGVVGRCEEGTRDGLQMPLRWQARVEDATELGPYLLIGLDLATCSEQDQADNSIGLK